MNASATRTLVLLRHAKSDWPPGVPDHERPLGARGRRDAPAAGDWIRQHVGTPDLAVVSTAQRTRETWGLASAQLDDGVPVRYDDDVYDAFASSLLSIVRATEPGVFTLVLVGHNPGTEGLASHLAGSGDDETLERMQQKYPTSGIAVLRFGCDWAEVGPQTGRLVAFAVPRG